MAISKSEEAVAAILNDHLGKATLRSYLALTLWIRLKQTGDLYDLHTAVKRGEEAVTSEPYNRSDKARWLVNLAAPFCTRFERTGYPYDLHVAILKAKKLWQRHHLTAYLHREAMLSNLAGSLCARF